MTYKQFPAPVLKTFAVIALAVLLIFTGTAVAEKAFFIDTTGLTGKVGATTQVPVKVTGAENLYSFELQCGIADNADYKIALNENSVSNYYYSQKTGKITQINLKNIGSDATLFYLDVTPKTANPVPLSLTSFLIQEGTEDTEIKEATYTAKGATLNIGGGESESPDDSPNDYSGGSSTVLPTPSETLPTYTPTAMPTDDAPKSGGSYLPYIIAALGVLAVLIIIIVVVKRRRNE